MKKFLSIFAVVAVLAGGWSCKKDEPTKPKDNTNGNNNENTEQQTGTAVNSINVTIGSATVKTAWAAGDEIQVYCVTNEGADIEAKYVLSEGAGTKTGKFAPAAGATALTTGGKEYFVAYPYDEDRTFAQHNSFTITVPADQTAPMPLFGHSADPANIEVSSFMGAVKFTLTGKANLSGLALEDANTNSILSGNVTYNASNGKVSIKNSSSSKYAINYAFASKLELNNSTSDPIIVEVPAGTLSTGGSIVLYDMNSNAVASIDFPAQTIAAGAVADLGNLSFKAAVQVVDLSLAGTANCYIVPDTGSYKFKAVKGNDANQTVDAASVEVFWETTCDPAEEEIASGCIVTGATLEDGYVVVTIADPYKPGNALIAAKDAEGNIIWSWHLWLPETTIANVEDPDNYFWKTAIMDRNLGALTVVDTTAAVSIKAYGLSFQWGRKDPLVGLHFATAGNGIQSAEGAQTLDYWIAHPNEISSGTNNNWLPETVTDLWEKEDGEKNIYDPCPVGYKVPHYDSEMPLFKTANKGGTDDDWRFDIENGWFYNKTVKAIFPTGGYLDGGAAKLTKEFIRTCIWSANPGDGSEVDPRGSASFVDVSRDSGKYYYRSYFKYAGGTVRCAVEH